MAKKLRITWQKSEIGYVRKQRLTLRALGFHRLNQTVEHDDTPAIRGMLAKVNHLVRTEVIDGSK
ncbi:MAG: 50S ribosomal protein L30 [Chloroflexi bacterium]|nr:50S ribosomal protein L30 [Chloroflexota bacterium]MBM3154317.1 50S ribosomal protein L30 [Chloroflexota bacterium]MBM3174473.1 50S ribosomal protein L30 [Chloroflexota bacterium]MBM4449577.1 50S ribosomal protein L30 [Chloroflexota bacterium]